jgi:hypothetical protein
MAQRNAEPSCSEWQDWPDSALNSTMPMGRVTRRVNRLTVQSVPGVADRADTGSLGVARRTGGVHCLRAGETDIAVFAQYS